MVTSTTLTLLRDVRAKDALLVAEAYCRNPDCPMREVTLHLKDYDRTLLALVSRLNGLSCPVCRGSLVLHWVQTCGEHDQRERQAARWNVNTQMYQRDHAPSPLLPVSVMLREDLPPTPPGWWTPEVM